MKPGLSFLIALLLAADSGVVVTNQGRAAEQPAARAAGDGPDVAPRTRGVLALYSDSSDQPVMLSFAQTFHDVLERESGNTVEHYPEYFDSARFPGESQERLMVDYLRRKYADRTIDVVFAWGPFTLPLVLEYRAELFPDTPIVYYSGTLDEVKDYPQPPMTGVLNPDTYERTLEVALRLHPETREVFIISGTPARDKSIERDVSRQLAEFQGRVRLTYLTDLSLDRLIATVKRLPTRSIIIYSRQQSQEDTGKVLQQADYLDLVSRSAPVPVYGPWRSLLGYGSVGGVVDDREAGATKAAEIVLRVARGARPQDIPPERTPRIPTFDARQLLRWGISEDRLPPGSVVLFRESSLWSQYRYYVIGTGAVVAVQALLIGALLVQRATRRRVESALRQSEQARVRQMSEQKRELEVQVAQRTQEVAALVAVSQSVTSARDLRTLLARILDELQRVLAHTGAVVLLREGDEFITSALQQRGRTRDDLLGRRFPISTLAPFHQTLVSTRPFGIGDVAEDSTFASAVADTIGVPPPYRGMMGAALVARSEAFGVLALWHATAGAVEGDDVSKLQGFANQVAIAIENARLYARSQRVAVLEERARLSRELHDSVTQSLHSIGLYANAAGRAMAIGKEDVGTAHLHEVQQLAQEAMHEMRALIFELRPAVLEERGLGPALRARLDSVEARTGVAVSLDTSGAPGEERLPIEAELELYRMAQEALNNVIKHARAEHVWVRLAHGDYRHAEMDVSAEGESRRCLVLEIRDDGAGFDLKAAQERPTTGLRSLAERAAKIGGTVTIVTAPHRGTTVRIELKGDGA